MANEISASMGLSFTKGGASESVTVVTTKFTMTGNNYVHETMLVPITAGGTSLQKGSIGTIGWSYFKNLDGSGNSVQILVTQSGSNMVQLYPGEFCMFRFTSGASSPAAIALTSAVYIDYFLIEN